MGLSHHSLGVIHQAQVPLRTEAIAGAIEETVGVQDRHDRDHGRNLKRFVTSGVPVSSRAAFLAYFIRRQDPTTRSPRGGWFIEFAFNAGCPQRYDAVVFEEEQVSADEAGYAIRPMGTEDVDAVLQILTEAFGSGFDHQWFQWKHRHGPWGPSLGWVADDGSGLLGVRLFLPWRLRERDRVYRAFRPCDTVTAPEARGRGVFRSLTKHAIASLDDGVDFLFNTPNERSKPGYLKMGFTEWGEVRQRVSFVLPLRTVLTDDLKPVSEGSGVRTDTGDRFLTWRYRDCPGWEYSTFGLEGEDANGIVGRVRTWHGMRLMVVSELWGEARQRAALVRGAAHELGARVAWYGDPFPGVGFPSLRRPSTTVTRYDIRAEEPGPQALSLGDVEDVL